MKKRGESEIIAVYHSINRNTLDESERDERAVNKAYDILFEEVVKRRLADKNDKPN